MENAMKSPESNLIATFCGRVEEATLDGGSHRFVMGNVQIKADSQLPHKGDTVIVHATFSDNGWTALSVMPMHANQELQQRPAPTAQATTQADSRLAEDQITKPEQVAPVATSSPSPARAEGKPGANGFAFGRAAPAPAKRQAPARRPSDPSKPVAFKMPARPVAPAAPKPQATPAPAPTQAQTPSTSLPAAPRSAFSKMSNPADFATTSTNKPAASGAFARANFDEEPQQKAATPSPRGTLNKGSRKEVLKSWCLDGEALPQDIPF